MEKIKAILKNRNVLLFIALIIALGLTYVFEEKRNKDRAEELARKTAILDVNELGDLIAFAGIKLNVQKKGDLYFAADNGLALSPKKLEEFMKILSGLKIKKILSPEETKGIDRSFYIPNNDLFLNFQFKNGGLKFNLGKKLDYDQTFYMEVTRGNFSQLMIVADESPDPNVYQSDEEYRRSEFKYQRLQMLFYLTNVFFYETRLFSEFHYAEDKINFKQIEIATFRNKKFSLNFEKSETVPPVYKGLSYFDQNWVEFLRSLQNVEAKTIYYPFNANKLDEALSVFNIEDRTGKKYSLEVYKKYGSLPGYFLKTSFNNILYELRTEDAKFFFVNVQDFWLKRIYPDNPDYEFELKFTKEAIPSIKFSVSDKDIFNASAVGKKVKLIELKKLIDFFKMHSDHVSELTDKPTELVGKMVMKLYFANRNIGVILDENDVLVVDLDNGLALHHYVGSSIPFSIKSLDYFEN